MAGFYIKAELVVFLPPFGNRANKTKMAKSKLLTKDDYWAIWIGFFLLFTGLILFFTNKPANLNTIHADLDSTLSIERDKAPYKTVIWYEAFDQQQKIKGASEPIGKFLKKLTSKPGSWSDNPLKSFVTTSAQADAAKAAAQKKFEQAKAAAADAKAKAERADQQAAMATYQDTTLNALAITAIDDWRNSQKSLSSAKKKYETSSSNKIPYLLGLLVFLGALFTIGSAFMGIKWQQFFIGFLFVFGIGLISYFLAGQANMKAIGFGYAAWAIVIGLLISNTIGTPEWVKPALNTPFYIKTGLVLLGAEILFGKILAIGLPGIFVAWVVTPIVLVSTYWFGQKVLKIQSKTLNMTVSADMSVCGVSAAVATAAACNASKEELTLSIGLSMVFTSVMMIVLPAFINWVGIPEVLGGAWIGGTIDATGAVVAAGAFLGDKALNVAATIKMIQNVLIGLIAFGVAVYFATKVEKTGETKVGFGEIWRRFPRFILGFIGASVLFSIIYELLGDSVAYTMIDQGVIAGFTKNMRGWMFCLAFVSIGLSTNFKELKKHFSGGKPLILYLCGQTLNLMLTLLMAYIMFYLVFPHITENI